MENKGEYKRFFFTRGKVTECNELSLEALWTTPSPSVNRRARETIKCNRELNNYHSAYQGASTQEVATVVICR